MPLFALQMINCLLQTCLPYFMFLKIKIATIHLITDIATQGCTTITYVTPTLFFTKGKKNRNYKKIFAQKYWQYPETFMIKVQLIMASHKLPVITSDPCLPKGIVSLTSVIDYKNVRLQMKALILC